MTEFVNLGTVPVLSYSVLLRISKNKTKKTQQKTGSR